MQGNTTVKGRYQIQGILSQFGPHITFRANDLLLKREAAFKTFNVIPETRAAQSFLKECEILASLSHPNIIEVVDLGEYEDAGNKKPFLVMPLLSGLTLEELIQAESRRLTPPRVAELMSQACRAIQMFHDRGMTHGNLAPSDIFVLKDDSIKIIRFDGSSTNNPAIDVCSLGEICYEALTLRKPGKQTVYPSICDLNPQVSPALDRVVRKAMSHDRADQFHSAREFGDALVRAAHNDPAEQGDALRAIVKPPSAPNVPLPDLNTAPPRGGGQGAAPGEFTSFFQLANSSSAPDPGTQTNNYVTPGPALSARTETIHVPISPSFAPKSTAVPEPTIAPGTPGDHTSADFQRLFGAGARKSEVKPAATARVQPDDIKTSIFAEIPEPFQPKKNDPFHGERANNPEPEKPGGYTQFIQSPVSLTGPSSSNGLTGTNTFKSPDSPSPAPVLRPPTTEPSEFTRYMKRPNFNDAGSAVAESPVQTDPKPAHNRSVVLLAVILGFLFVIAVFLVAWFAIKK